MRFIEENEKCLLLCCWNESFPGMMLVEKKIRKIYYLEVPGLLGGDQSYVISISFLQDVKFPRFFSSFEFSI